MDVQFIIGASCFIILACVMTIVLNKTENLFKQNK